MSFLLATDQKICGIWAERVRAIYQKGLTASLGALGIALQQFQADWLIWVQRH